MPTAITVKSVPSFSSSVFNHRTDEYGGSAENRVRFAAEAVSAVRRSVPDIPIDYTLAVRQENPHYGNAGILEEELGIFIPILEKAGVACSARTANDNHDSCEAAVSTESANCDNISVKGELH